MKKKNRIFEEPAGSVDASHLAFCVQERTRLLNELGEKIAALNNEIGRADASLRSRMFSNSINARNLAEVAVYEFTRHGVDFYNDISSNLFDRLEQLSGERLPEGKAPKFSIIQNRD